ncbi:hypothetical protein NSB25_08310 [Acetatifactor muris]|jgi:hypothetical protein|uniref:Uncharacterized protein n=1 Tax=Acetatifactor muris TaxID=879566 RepID=A0A2K4ZF36_9FIRM|nr:hypothetical protein [Acetatifactor muris]MCR2047277.1 hypothetical protein [Acetatifactor muris]SOY29082.1 hypothetical protein AMURIS_01797 [Acetatifactor muris]
MNAASIMKLMSAKNQFSNNHPKFEAFLNSVFSKKMEEGTVIEMTVTRPGEKPLTANLKVQQSDLELLEELKGLMK